MLRAVPTHLPNCDTHMSGEQYDLQSHSLFGILHLPVISFPIAPNFLPSYHVSRIVSKHHIIDMFLFVIAILVYKRIHLSVYFKRIKNFVYLQLEGNYQSLSDKKQNMYLVLSPTYIK